MKREKRSEGDGRKNIMIVDDDESMRLLIGSYLKNDYNLIIKSDGLEAMTFLKDNDFPDLILLDMEMPNLNGRIFLRRLKIGGPKMRKIPIIFISAVTSKIMAKSTLKHGAIDYIVKPFDPDELISKVKNIFVMKNGEVES